MDMRFERRLLQLIRENEIIYNPRHPKFKMNKSRMEVWDAIAKELHSDVETCRRRWRGLRNTYRKIKTKNATLGFSDTETLVSKWCYLDDLTFVDRYDTLIGKKSGSNSLYASQQQQSVEEMEAESQQKDTFILSKERVQAISDNRKSSIELEDNLVQEIRKYKLLWDKTHPDYRNNYQKSFVWKIIAKNLQTHPKACRSLWLSMQSRYRRKKIQAYEEDGQIFYHTRWKYWGKMAFINHHQKSSCSGECSASDVEQMNDLQIWKDDTSQIEEVANSIPDASIENLRTKDKSCELKIYGKINNVETCTTKRIRQQSQSEDDQDHRKRQKLSHGNISKCSPATVAVDASCSNYLYTLGTKLDDLKIPLRVKYDLERRVGNLVYEVLAQFSVDDN